MNLWMFRCDEKLHGFRWEAALAALMSFGLTGVVHHTHAHPPAPAGPSPTAASVGPAEFGALEPLVPFDEKLGIDG